MHHAIAAYALVLAATLAGGCASSINPGSGTGDGDGGSDDASASVLDLSRGGCLSAGDCDGGACVNGACCATVACGGQCCAEGSVCLFDRCVAPGKPCHTA